MVSRIAGILPYYKRKHCNMALSVFDNKSRTPQDGELAEALGRTSNLWRRLKALLASEYEPLTETWKFSGQNWGWSLQLKEKKRTVLYLTPCRGYFIAGFALGEKAVKAAHQRDLPVSVLDMIDSARRYMEGRAVRLEVRNSKDVGIVEKLATIKMAH